VTIANLLYIHANEASGDHYFNAGQPVEVAQLRADAFSYQADGSLSLINPITLAAGRYTCVAHFSAAGTDNEIFAGISTDRGRLLRYYTYTKLMAETYRDWAFNVSSVCQMTPYIQFVRGEDSSLVWQGATIYRYPGFDAMRPSVVF
jgi:hypothetical protein